jgi:para-aminobenzoate synthetase component 1
MAKRQFQSFPFSDLYKIKRQVLNWSARFDTCCFLDSHSYPSSDHGYECLVAVGERKRLSVAAGDAFVQLRKFSLEQNDWLFGHFSFDLKSETENSASRLPDFIQFPDLFFFVPEIILLIQSSTIEIGLFGNQHQRVLDEIEKEQLLNFNLDGPYDAQIQNRISKEEYIQVIKRLQLHIQRGDCYEINFCQEFFAENILLNPLPLYEALSQLSPSPFSAFYKMDQKFLLCSSPERFLKRKGDLILSQPIKGTAARDPSNPKNDEALRLALATSEKDRAENVMVVDLVRNDLSKICERNSVRVDELYGIYSFPQVHQMISTIVGKPLQDLHWTEMVARTFPMGSMTGAPKKSVLELTEQFEKSKRGLFSGALGYVKPDQDFDFNVVIRSILYNKERRYMAYFAGSAITINSDPETEYEECLLKAATLKKVIENPSR